MVDLMHFRTLKINIVLNIGILLIAGMLVTDFIVTSIFKKELLKAEFARTEFIIGHIKDNISHLGNNSEKYDYVHRYLSNIIKVSDVYLIYLENGHSTLAIKNPVVSNNYKNKIKVHKIRQYSLQAIAQHRRITHFFDSTWSVFFKDSKYLVISYPVDHHMGISFIIVLDRVYSSLREKQKIIMFYILFNTVFLCFIGMIRFSNIIIKPIKKLTGIVEGYDGSNDALYMLNSADNEFGLLSSSLNSMVNRISDDKQKLEKNIEKLEKTQKEMIRAEKMSSIGKLSAGVAHEIGNPIGIVLGYLELLKQESISDADKKDFINRSEVEIQRIDKIIKQLLNLSRSSQIEYLPNSVHDIIKDAIDIIKIQPFFSTIRFEFELNADEDVAMFDSDQLKQVLINLILNAADGIGFKNFNGEQGIVQVKTIKIKKNDVSFIEIKISDNGVGISKHDLNKIFDPFFTTKEPGLGTGLGLWMSYMIIDEINGFISAESIEGEGATFIIKLPLHEDGK